MAYLALYRKLRPKSFAQVVGQEHVVRTLRNQVAANRAGHAYLFMGARGTGKTTLARIFARALNCLNPAKGEACEACDSCIRTREQSPNIIEIDAASNNSVDNIRQLREEVRHLPLAGSLKVYIIDEVHMLSTGAFNALLKTLEEPPAHAYFILATTEAHKVPATIASRCQRFQLRRIGASDMATALRGYMRNEGIHIEEGALEYIISLADGAMRDALSILDHVVSYFGAESITHEAMARFLGAGDETAMFALTKALLAGEAPTCLGIIDEIVAAGCDIRQFVDAYIRHLRDIFVLISAGRAALANETPKRLERLESIASQCSKKELMRILEGFVELGGKLRLSGHERTTLEVACLRIIEPQNKPLTPAASIQEIPPKTMQIADIKASIEVSDEEVIKRAKVVFPEIYKKFDMPIRGALRDSCWAVAAGDALELVVSDKYVKQVEGKKGSIAAELAGLVGAPVPIRIMTQSQFEKNRD